MLYGNGDGTFDVASTFTAGSAPAAVAVGDLNGDGKADLAVANYGSNTVSILLGNGNGTFQPAVDFAAGTGPFWVAMGDFNRDGFQDLAVANYGSNSVSVLLGNGDGTFRAPVSYATDTNSAFVIAADFNGDGILDLAVANSNSNSVTMLLGNGDGTFRSAPTVFPGGWGPSSIAVGDFNGDGSQDLVIADFGSNTVSVLINDTIVQVKTATPTFTPAAGTYLTAVTVTLSDTTSGAAIFYTTDGSTPTPASTRYTTPIVVTQTTTIKAMATAPGMADSSVASSTYTIKVANPTFGVPAGTYDQPQTVSLADATSGATIYYTTDGSTPTTASTRYLGPIAVNRSLTIRTMATAAGMVNSDVVSAVYTLKAATPVFDPQGGRYLLPLTVSISDASPNTTIYYTTDGSTPTTASTRYTMPITVLLTTTIKAIAVAPGWSTSNVATATYTTLSVF